MRTSSFLGELNTSPLEYLVEKIKGNIVFQTLIALNVFDMLLDGRMCSKQQSLSLGSDNNTAFWPYVQPLVTRLEYNPDTNPQDFLVDIMFYSLILKLVYKTYCLPAATPNVEGHVLGAITSDPVPNKYLLDPLEATLVKGSVGSRSGSRERPNSMKISSSTPFTEVGDVLAKSMPILLPNLSTRECNSPGEKEKRNRDREREIERDQERGVRNEHERESEFVPLHHSRLKHERSEGKIEGDEEEASDSDSDSDSSSSSSSDGESDSLSHSLSEAQNSPPPSPRDKKPDIRARNISTESASHPLPLSETHYLKAKNQSRSSSLSSSPNCLASVPPINGINNTTFAHGPTLAEVQKNIIMDDTLNKIIIFLKVINKVKKGSLPSEVILPPFIFSLLKGSEARNHQNTYSGSNNPFSPLSMYAGLTNASN